MAQFEILSMQERGVARQQADFNEMLYESLKQAPWWLASAVAHLVFGLLAIMLIGDPRKNDSSLNKINSSIAEQTPELEEEVKPDIQETKPIDEQEKVTEQPVLKEAKIDDHNETDNEMETEESLGDPRFNSDSPFQGQGTNSDIGIGGGAGGMFGGRKGGHRNLRAEGGGGTEGATEAGLEWLKNHQNPAGYWDCDGFSTQCKKNKCDGPGQPLYDPGISGLSLLAFLGYGETHKTPRYGKVVREGLKYLKGIQDAEGCFGPRTSQHFTYNHAICALAMAEAYGLTQSPLFKTSAQNGIDFVHKCQNPYMAWRYGVRPQDNDSSVTGWMVMALKSANGAGLRVDPSAFEGAKTFLDKITEPEYGRAGYTARGNGPARPQNLLDKFPADKSESLTAVAILTRIFCGADKNDEWVKKGADLCVKLPPTWDKAAGTIDMYYWYYGTLAMFQFGGDHWKKWNEAMKTAIIGSQHIKDKGDDRWGSWDPEDPWGHDGGRVYSTATMVLCLEVYYRYGRVFGTK
jgi:hypothetical protein